MRLNQQAQVFRSLRWSQIQSVYSVREHLHQLGKRMIGLFEYDLFLIIIQYPLIPNFNTYEKSSYMPIGTNLV